MRIRITLLLLLFSPSLFGQNPENAAPKREQIRPDASRLLIRIGDDGAACVERCVEAFCKAPAAAGVPMECFKSCVNVCSASTAR